MLRLAFSPRWIVWHVLTLGAMATCAWLAIWQWQRAGSAMGSALNVGYGLQWPLFAIFFGAMWWRLLRMEFADLKVRSAEPAPEVAVEPQALAPEPRAVEPEPQPIAGGPSPFGPRPASARPAVLDNGDGDDEDDAELAAYNRMLAQLAARYPDD